VKGAAKWDINCMAIVYSLGEEYSNFASFLILLKSLDKEKLKAAFLAKKNPKEETS